MKKYLFAGLLAVGLVLAGACEPASQPPPADTTMDDTTDGPRGSTREGQRTLVVPIITAVSQTDVIALAHQPGYAFEFVKCEVYARTEAGVVTAMVKIGTSNVFTAAAGFATATRTTVTLRNGAPRQGGPTSVINFHFTSDGTGALTNGFVVCQIRPLGGG